MALIDNIVHYYKLDGSEDPVVDELGTNDGTNAGAVPSAAGKINTAYDFQGPDNSQVDVTGMSIGKTSSISMWVYIDTYPAGRSYAFDAQAGRLIIALSNAGNLDYYDNGTFRTFGTALSTGSWHHLVLTLNEGTSEAKMYVDGSQYGLTQSYSGINIAGTGIAISGPYVFGLTDGVDGRIDEVGFWSRVLGSAEIGPGAGTLYNNGNGLAYPFVVGTNMQVNISDVLKDISEIKINIGGVLKDVTEAKINIGDVLKDVF